MCLYMCNNPLHSDFPAPCGKFAKMGPPTCSAELLGFLRRFGGGVTDEEIFSEMDGDIVIAKECNNTATNGKVRWGPGGCKPWFRDPYAGAGNFRFTILAEHRTGPP